MSAAKPIRLHLFQVLVVSEMSDNEFRKLQLEHRIHEAFEDPFEGTLDMFTQSVGKGIRVSPKYRECPDAFVRRQAMLQLASTPCRVLVAEEEHGTHYLAAATPEDLEAAAFHLLDMRYADGWYGSLEDLEKEAASEVNRELTQAELAALPPGLQQVAADHNRHAAERQKHLAQHGKWLQDLLHILKHPDTYLQNSSIRAWTLLQMRSKNQYERVSLETVTFPDRQKGGRS